MAANAALSSALYARHEMRTSSRSAIQVGIDIVLRAPEPIVAGRTEIGRIEREIRILRDL